MLKVWVSTLKNRAISSLSLLDY
ncbi:UNVERIFIED_CONTAM: hypothetical protein GTU68_064700 [Idotea baltica]|nr:hypothetical protein [Idotea baltica]